MMLFRRGGMKKNKWLVGLVVLVVGYNFVAPWANQQFGLSLPELNNNQAHHQSSSSGHRPATSDDGAAAHATGPKWSSSRPAINLHHVFQGEINGSGKPVGFHSRPGGRDPATARVVRVKDGPNRAGVYTASIEIRDGSQWKEKFSSFFPDNMSIDQVNEAILAAYENRTSKTKQPWRGPRVLPRQKRRRMRSRRRRETRRLSGVGFTGIGASHERLDCDVGQRKSAQRVQRQWPLRHDQPEAGHDRIEH